MCGSDCRENQEDEVYWGGKESVWTRWGDEVCGVWDDGVAIDLEDWMERGNIDARDDGELGELSSPAKLSISTILAGNPSIVNSFTNFKYT